MAMSAVGFLSEDIVAFIMRALLDGRIDRDAACRLLVPWVEGDGPSSMQAESGAQLVHGFDIVLDAEGRAFHASDLRGAHDRTYVVTDAELFARSHAWLARLGRE